MKKGKIKYLVPNSHTALGALDQHGAEEVAEAEAECFAQAKIGGGS